jgi:hypothetical protein
MLHLYVIVTINHKGLRIYFEEGNGAKLPHE